MPELTGRWRPARRPRVLRASGAVGVSLTGNEFASSLIGGRCDDRLNGGAGDDYLVGRSGADIFAFGVGLGQDTIGDLQGGHQSSRLQRLSLRRFRQPHGGDEEYRLGYRHSPRCEQFGHLDRGAIVATPRFGPYDLARPPGARSSLPAARSSRQAANGKRLGDCLRRRPIAHRRVMVGAEHRVNAILFDHGLQHFRHVERDEPGLLRAGEDRTSLGKVSRLALGIGRPVTAAIFG
ncbi:MAG: hypothetical protein KIS73_24535 [Enhydrobacter sp.]|nr:hypothetical protein [Enhydrobacter sp.]